MKQLEGKRDVKTRVIQFLTVGDVMLTAEEEKILSRWEAADLAMRQKVKKYDEIVEFIALRFGVSKFTAQNDIATAQDVFSRSRKTNKKYHLHLHAERIDRQLELFQKRWSDNDYVPDAKEMAAYAKLLDAYTYCMNSMPEDAGEDKTPPPLFFFNLVKGDQVIIPMSVEDALKSADAFIAADQQKEAEEGIEDIDFTEENE